MPDRAAPPRSGAVGQTLLGIAGAVLLLAVAVVALVVIGSRGEGTASGMDPAVPPDVAVPEAPETPSPPPGLASPEGNVTSIEREPTDGDAAAFTAAYDPPGGRDVEWITADLDADGRSEVVVASIGGERTRVDVAMWEGDSYAVRYTGHGGPADAIEGFAVRDLTGDGLAEILIEQRSGGRRSIALWGVTPEGIARLEGRGGCWDGSHVYGYDGAEVAGGTLTASCDPGEADERFATYVWDGEAWVHDPDGSVP